MCILVLAATESAAEHKAFRDKMRRGLAVIVSRQQQTAAALLKLKGGVPQECYPEYVLGDLYVTQTNVCVRASLFRGVV